MTKEFPTEAVFFNLDNDNISKRIVVDILDNNVKGLREDEDKFHSFIVSPSSDELTFIGDDENSLKAFGREAMNEYVEAFNYDRPPSNIDFGEILEVGESNRVYDDGKMSREKVFFVKFRDYETNKIKTVWNADLKNQINDNHLQIGDLIRLENKGKESVKTPYYDKANNYQLFETKRVLYNVKGVSIEEVLEGIKPIRKVPPLTINDFVWFACVHHSREYSKGDQELSLAIHKLKSLGVDVDNIDLKFRSNLPLGSNGMPATLSMIKHFYEVGQVKEGQTKKGLNSHLHFVVSARSVDMTKTFHPNTRSGFRRQPFCIGIEDRFIKLFGFDKENQTEFKFLYQKVQRSLEAIQKKYALDKAYFDPELLQKQFLNSKDKGRFSSNLKQLDRLFKNNKFIEDPGEFLDNNRQDFRTREDRIALDKSIAMPSTNLAKVLSSFGQGSHQPVFQIDNFDNNRKKRRGRNKSQSKDKQESRDR